MTETLDYLLELTSRIKKLEDRVKALEGNKRTTFKPPTLEEVKEYCKERKNKVEPGRFVDFYTSKNWMIGKTKMKDWKAAIRNWERSTMIAEASGTTATGRNEQMELPEDYGKVSETAITREEYLARKNK